MGACRVAVNVASLIADSGAITGRVRTRSQCETRKKKKRRKKKEKEEIGAEAGSHATIKEEERESSFRLFWFFCYNQCRDYRRVIKHGRTEIVLCFPQRRNERERRGLKMWENLLFRLVGGTPDDFVDKVMWYGWPNVFTRQMNAARLVSRDLRVVRAQTRHIADFSGTCARYIRFVDSTSSRAIAFFRDSCLASVYSIVRADRIFQCNSAWKCRERFVEMANPSSISINVIDRNIAITLGK